MKRQLWALTAVGAALALGASACVSSGNGGGSSGKFNAGSTSVVNASSHKGGTLRFGDSDDFDSTDGGNEYYAWTLNFNRLYERALTTFVPKPNGDGVKIEGDLATGPGTPSNGMRDWTYHLRPGLKYEDGSPVKAADVKYAIARTYDRGILGKGPSYFSQLTVDAATYKGPYKDKNLDDFKGVTTPDDSTVVIHFKDPFPDMDYLVTFPQTAPVPQAKDTGTQYALHPLATGPYMWQGQYKPKVGGTLVRNPNWDPATDPIRKALPDKITFQAGVNQDTLDQDLIKGIIDVDAAGTGVAAQARKQILSDPKLKGNSDDPVAGFHWYVPIDTQVIPDVNCRKAIIYAADRDAMWRAYGGDVGGEMSTSVMPPNVVGRQPSNLYPAKPGDTGDVAKAKQALAACGKPNGFSFKMIYRSDRPKELAAAQAIAQSLAKAGIQVQLQGYPSGDYTSSQAGSPSFMKQNNVGMAIYGWAADWPTGYGYLDPISNGTAIVASGNSNVSMLNDPTVNKLWTQVVTMPNEADREKVYNQIDNIMLEQAVILPNVYAKSLLYRPSNLTNVFFQQQYGMYDYTALGVSK
jgi:peptide/nickel transport system substrate-binding protein